MLLLSWGLTLTGLGDIFDERKFPHDTLYGIYTFQSSTHDSLSLLYIGCSMFLYKVHGTTRVQHKKLGVGVCSIHIFRISSQVVFDKKEMVEVWSIVIREETPPLKEILHGYSGKHAPSYLFLLIPEQLTLGTKDMIFFVSPIGGTSSRTSSSFSMTNAQPLMYFSKKHSYKIKRNELQHMQIAANLQTLYST